MAKRRGPEQSPAQKLRASRGVRDADKLLLSKGIAASGYVKRLSKRPRPKRDPGERKPFLQRAAQLNPEQQPLFVMPEPEKVYRTPAEHAALAEELARDRRTDFVWGWEQGTEDVEQYLMEELVRDAVRTLIAISSLRAVAVCPKLIELTGWVDMGILLSHLDWHEHHRQQRHRGARFNGRRYVYLTYKQLAAELGWDWQRVDRVGDRLSAAGFVDKRQGKHAGRKQTHWRVSQRVKEVEHEHPIAYSPDVARLCKSPTEGLFLCQLIHWMRIHAGSDRPEGWTWDTEESLAKQIGISSRQIRRVATSLVAQKFLFRGQNGKQTQWVVCADALCDAIGFGIDMIDKLHAQDQQKVALVIQEWEQQQQQLQEEDED